MVWVVCDACGEEQGWGIFDPLVCKHCPSERLTRVDDPPETSLPDG